MQIPKTCCGRAGETCVCASQAKCSCGAQEALHCNCEKASKENTEPVLKANAIATALPPKTLSRDRPVSVESEKLAIDGGLMPGETDFTTKA
ncbi:MAG: hypothetical protein M1816_000937 [Peltula sp. TS41687]|nr:MAG: hypothetical protein M1816_000937 [Peltula sp. TS41687]